VDSDVGDTGWTLTRNVPFSSRWEWTDRRSAESCTATSPHGGELKLTRGYPLANCAASISLLAFHGEQGSTVIGKRARGTLRLVGRQGRAIGWTLAWREVHRVRVILWYYRQHVCQIASSRLGFLISHKYISRYVLLGGVIGGRTAPPRAGSAYNTTEGT